MQHSERDAQSTRGKQLGGGGGTTAKQICACLSKQVLLLEDKWLWGGSSGLE
jgi:hypothetical protein